MSLLIPSSTDLPETAPDDRRLGHLIGSEATADTASAVLVGYPSDEGVRLNGGRPGAAAGPSRLRRLLYRLTPDSLGGEAFARLLARTVDVGDVNVTGDVATDQERLGKVIEPYMRRGAVPVILGGGHELGFGHFLGYVYAGRSVHIVNWDAHPDVRPLIDGRPHSGSSFSQALRHVSGTCGGYTAVGIAPYHCAPDHVAFLRDRGADVVWRDEVTGDTAARLYEKATGPVMASFDLDAVDQSQAPGVSAPTAGGLTADVWLSAALESGRSKAVASFDIAELNPGFDVDGQTARLAAVTVWSFLRGLSERSLPGS